MTGDEKANVVPVAFGGNRTSGPVEVATACNAHGGPHGRLDFESETFVVGTLGAGGKTAGSATTQDAEQNLLVPIPFDTTQITSPKNFSEPEPEPAPGDPSHPLARGAHPPAIAFHLTQDPISGEVTPAMSGGNRQGCATLGVATPILEPGRRSGRSTDDRRIGIGIGEPGDPMFTLPAERPHGVQHGMAVRRLTPRECERLQGFPDDYTAIPGAKDGPRYRALGNSMAVPVMRHIGRRIMAVERSP
jgi:DNA (cytosine-5)-methyltransferase 1